MNDCESENLSNNSVIHQNEALVGTTSACTSGARFVSDS